MNRAIRLLIVATIWLCGDAVAQAQFDIDQPPLSYTSTPPHDRVARLQERLASGKAQLSWDGKSGYLPALLKELKVSDKSQVLVFSKTSFQRNKIAPQTPRALYFVDDVYLGWCQNGDVMEFAAVDPRQGAMFYTLEQQPSAHPKITRQVDSCIQCHASSLSGGVPGFVVRSVFPDAAGMPILSTSTYHTTFRSPLAQRWGGWYVTGTHGSQRHMGNMLVSNPNEPDRFDAAKGANRRDLSGLVDTSPYRTPYSDIVALMVLEHQTAVHNQITLANYETRLALRDQQALDQLDGKPAPHRCEGVQHRIDSAATTLVEYLLFVDEAPLTDPIQGVSGYAEYFSALGPRDSQGRSLRDFDLRRRMFKYPCSFLIYSAAFDALQAPLKESVYRKLAAVLTGKDTSPTFAHLSATDRRAIREILDETKPEWRKVPN